jgi:hypothetical protein
MALLSFIADSAGGSVYDVLLAMLNVVQTVALAYLAADRQATRAVRREAVRAVASHVPPSVPPSSGV